MQPTASPEHAATVGPRLAALREKAGMSQIDLARRMTWSATVLSRAEGGDRPLTHEEARQLATEIGTPEASKFLEVLGRSWVALPQPPWDHPDQDLLWRAEGVAVRLRQRMDDAATPAPFARRLSAYVEELTRIAAMILKREHRIAFIGPIGVGKSTAICRVLGLEVPASDRQPSVPVLEAGAGGITICEVHVLRGPAYGIRVEPCSDDEVRAHVMDFAEQVWRTTGRGDASREADEGELEGVSKEIERAIRNMSGLTNRREKGIDGKPVRKDAARELALATENVRELVVKVLELMQLPRRDRRDAWYEPGSGRDEREWLKETFERINNGRSPEFGLPKRIEVLVPHGVLDGTDLSVGIVDTKGLDKTAARGDIECHLDEPHTLAVLCSGFNDAPGTHPLTLLQRAVAAGVRGLADRALLLVLPRSGEALAVKDDGGERVSTDEEGYELKGDQASMALEPLRAGRIEPFFFNSHRDAPADLRRFLIQRLEALRLVYASRLGRLCDEVADVLTNQEFEQAKSVLRHAAGMIRTWIDQQEGGELVRGQPEDPLLQVLQSAHASSVRATVKRKGSWSVVDYSHNLGRGARTMAAQALGIVVESFTKLCATMAANADYAGAGPMIEQAGRALSDAFEGMLRRVQLLGETSLAETVQKDVALWAQCADQRGRGYRDRVVQINKDWFTSEKQAALREDVASLVRREWTEALGRLGELVTVD